MFGGSAVVFGSFHIFFCYFHFAVCSLNNVDIRKFSLRLFLSRIEYKISRSIKSRSYRFIRWYSNTSTASYFPHFSLICIIIIIIIMITRIIVRLVNKQTTSICRRHMYILHVFLFYSSTLFGVDVAEMNIAPVVYSSSYK